MATNEDLAAALRKLGEALVPVTKAPGPDWDRVLRETPPDRIPKA